MKARIPDHINNVAKHVVTLNVEVQNENRLLKEEIAKVDVRQTRIMALSSKLAEEEQLLVELCREWISSQKVQ